ncbi:MAG: pyridoxal 5'-phosphate synthase glutaminase subunit PdxT [Spirochaetaceae bacterium]
MSESTIRLGVLALQGDFSLHLSLIREMARAELPAEAYAVEAAPVKTVSELDAVDALVVPGGESTTIGMLMERFGLLEAVGARAAAGMPVFGTCAGAILLATHIVDSDQPRLGLIPMTVTRNAYGRQIESFEVTIDGVDADVQAPQGRLQGVFIRAPIISAADPAVRVLAEYDGDPVVVAYGPHLAATFHPELVRERSLHRYFLRRLVSDAGNTHTRRATL